MTVAVQEEWFEKALGLYVNPDNFAGFQCVDTIKHYAMFIFDGVPWKESTRAGNAEDMWAGANKEFFRKIRNDPNDPDQLPRRGDYLVWEGDTENNPYGHIAVAEDVEKHGSWVFEQDGFLQTPIAKAFREYYLPGVGMLIGWVRPRVEKMKVLGTNPAGNTEPSKKPEGVLHGIDVSGWQKGIDFADVPADFVIAKATGGTDFVSNSFPEQWEDTKRLGERKGLYHFAREAYCKGSAVQEAQQFLSVTRECWDGATVPVLDWEGDNTHDTGWALEWLEIVRQTLGVKPLIYMNLSTANSHDWSKVQDKGYQLWLAQYPTSAHQGYGPLAPLQQARGWSTVMWQYSSSGRLPGWGGNLDLNVFYGGGKDWADLCGGKAVTPKAPKPDRPSKPADSKPADGQWVIVEAGDSLSSIVEQWGSSVGDIAAANGIANVALIYPGQQLLIPAGDPKEKVQRMRSYTIRAGDTLSSVANRFGSTYQAIASASGIRNPNVIHVGQIVTIPGEGGTTRPKRRRQYTVKAGDTLSGIASAHGVGWKAIAAENALANPNVIYPGQKLRIP